MSSARTLTLLGTGAALLVACAAVADLDVAYNRGAPPQDLDEAGAGSDSASPFDGGPGGGAGGGGEAETDAPATFAACSCSAERGCCLPATGAGVCTDLAAAGTCTASNGVFLRCSAGDVVNGRACCLATGTKSSFFAASCEDAGAQLCATSEECLTGVCQPIACRSVVLGVCAPEGGALPACAPP